MKLESMIHEMKSSAEFFLRSTRPLGNQHGDYRPTPGQMSVKEQIGHAAHTLEWFMDGAFSATGFDMNWAAHAELAASVASVDEAKAWFRRAMESAIARVQQAGEAGMHQTIVPGPIMGGEPRWHVVNSIVDHCAHHRGALTVYARLQGLEPPMPYMD